MSEVISYEELRRIQNAERDNKELQPIADDFFDKVKDYLNAKRKLLEDNKGSDNAFSRVSAEQCEQELKNIDKILSDICSRRNRKIAMQALTNLNARVHNTERMLPFEEKFYTATLKLLKENSDTFMSNFESKPAEPVANNGNGSSSVPLLFMEAVPAFAWSDGRTYGPYTKDDVAKIPSQVGEILIKEGKAIELVVREASGEQA
jgi:DNA replication initiation complex subunit (GINS family)